MTDDPLPVAGVMAVALCAMLRGWRCAETSALVRTCKRFIQQNRGRT